MTKKSFCKQRVAPYNYWRDKYIICGELLLFAPTPFSYVGFNFGFPLIGWIADLIILSGGILFAIRWYCLFKGKKHININTSYLTGIFALLFFVYTTALIGLICMSYNEGIKSVSTNNHTVEVAYWFYLAASLLITDIIAIIIYRKRRYNSHYC
ncbi:MAG: hypothetical protein K2K26_03030 [Muribaculaceae bacterium]|nr:hypothetical protein [Muribaculaceae bacterium]